MPYGSGRRARSPLSPDQPSTSFAKIAVKGAQRRLTHRHHPHLAPLAFDPHFRALDVDVPAASGPILPDSVALMSILTRKAHDPAIRAVSVPPIDSSNATVCSGVRTWGRRRGIFGDAHAGRGTGVDQTVVFAETQEAPHHRQLARDGAARAGSVPGPPGGHAQGIRPGGVRGRGARARAGRTEESPVNGGWTSSRPPASLNAAAKPPTSARVTSTTLSMPRRSR